MFSVFCLCSQHKTLAVFLFGLVFLFNYYLFVRIRTYTYDVQRISSPCCNNTSPTKLKRSNWLTERKRHQQNKVKLFLFAYMRGGSSVVGELFNTDPSATMWYEPGDAFFSAHYGLFEENLPQHDLYFSNMTRRKLDSDELEAMLRFYNNKFSCNYEDLPPEAMAHSFLYESTAMDGYVNCMKGKRTKNVTINNCKRTISHVCSSNLVERALAAKCHVAIERVKRVLSEHPNISNDADYLKFLQEKSLMNSDGFSLNDSQSLLPFIKHGRCIETMRRDNAKCIDKAIRKCKDGKLRVVQVNRMKMEDLEPIIEANPDIHVVHYTRDPRAIAFSRMKTRLLCFYIFNKTTVREAEFVCQRMREDIKQRTILEKKYPGVFTHLTYESLVLDPEGFARKIYGLFNLNYPKQWKSFVAKNMYAPKARGTFGIRVQNATKVAFRWRSGIPRDQQTRINNFCSDVVTSLGYEL